MVFVTNQGVQKIIISAILHTKCKFQTVDYASRQLNLLWIQFLVGEWIRKSWNCTCLLHKQIFKTLKSDILTFHWFPFVDVEIWLSLVILTYAWEIHEGWEGWTKLCMDIDEESCLSIGFGHERRRCCQASLAKKDQTVLVQISIENLLLWA